MVKLKLVRVAAAAAASAGLIASFSGVAGATSWNGNSDWGGCGCHGQHDRHHNRRNNLIVLTDTKTIEKNNVDVDNTTNQRAFTGNATVNGNNNKGHDDRHNRNNNSNGTAVSGDATNNNSTNINANVTNTPPDPVTMPDLHLNDGSKGNNNTVIKTNTKTIEINNVSVDNTTNQTASSGNATVNGGRNSTATSGDASNWNSTSVSLNVQN